MTATDEKLLVATTWTLVEWRGEIIDFDKLRAVAARHKGFYFPKNKIGYGFAFGSRKEADSFCEDEEAKSLIKGN